MTEYLSKEEIKQWRSSVEKITLEEFAARLGKTIQEEKKTHDIVDIIYNSEDGKSNEPEKSISYYQKPEKLDSFLKSDKADFSKPKTHEIPKHEPQKHESVKKPLTIEKKVEDIKIEKTVAPEPEIKEVPIKTSKEIKETKEVKEVKKPAPKAEKTVKVVKAVAEAPKTVAKAPVSNSASGEFNITLRKSLTEREQAVFDYFKTKRGEIIFAKDLADLLDLKRDYIYKYIKNLRAKIVEDIILNSDNGGFLPK